MQLRLIAVAAGAALLAACEGTVAPETPEGRYTLQIPRDTLLTAWTEHTGFELREGTMELSEPNRVQLVLDARVYDMEGEMPPSRSDTLRGTYAVQGEALALTITEASGPYALAPGATLRGNRRIAVTLALAVPARTGYLSYGVPVTFTR